ncbi:MAG: helix-turn-helix transcriptional regulator [Bacteroidota bacterium]|nr:helix-turn-helix transcriptional regulator [Bacteroidota bacterium]
MKYRDIPLFGFKLLSKYAAFVYEIKSCEEISIYKTIPNGKIGLSITTDGTASIKRESNWFPIPPTTIYGLTKETQEIKLSKQFGEIAIGFEPCFLQLFIPENMSHLTGGKTVDLQNLFDKFEVEKLIELIQSANTDSQLLLAIETFLSKQLNLKKTNEKLITALELITELSIYEVDEIANRINVSTSTLRNLFNEYIGVPPKDFIRITRINKAMHHQVNSENNLTDLSYTLGYFDQAHFIHDFKNVLGISPKQYFKNTALTFDFYNFGRWQKDNFAT